MTTSWKRGLPLLAVASLAFTWAMPPLEAYLSFETRIGLCGTTMQDGAVRLAWVESVAGASNIVVSERAHGQANFSTPRSLTAYQEDDGMEISHLAFTPGGANLLYTRAPSDDANPLHLAAPPAQAIVSVGWTGKGEDAPRTLAPHKIVTQLPNGTGALYATSSDNGLIISSVFLNGTSSTLLRTKHGSLGAGGATFSPSGRTLAFSNDRMDHGFIGLFDYGCSADGQTDIAGGLAAISWVAPSVDTDSYPTWSPDGTRLAFIRLRDQTDAKGRAGYLHQGAPFSVMVADVPPALRGGCCDGGCPETAAAAQRSAAIALMRGVGVREVFRDWKIGYPGTGNNGYGARPLVWSDDSGTLLVGAETSGFVHVVAIDAAGEVSSTTDSGTESQTAAVLDLTPALCENQDWRLGGGGWLYVAHNCDLVDSTGLARLRVPNSSELWSATTERVAPQREIVARGELHIVSGMSGDEWGGAGVVALGNGVALVQSTDKESTNILWWTPDEGTLRIAPAAKPRKASSRAVPSDASFNNSAFVTPQLVSFKSQDELFDIHAQLFTPPAEAPIPGEELNGRSGSRNGAPKLRPAIIFTHGGSQRQMYLAMHYSQCYAALYALNQYFAARGFVVLSVNYRSGVGYGRAFRLCEGGQPATARRCGWRGGAEYDDVLAARRWLGGQAGIDSARVGIHGLSYGGLNCLQALTRNPDLFAAGACNAPVFNWVSISRTWGSKTFDYEPRLGGFRNLAQGPEPDIAGPAWRADADANIKLAWQSSPASHVANLTSPLLLIHGDSDANVDFQETVGLVRALRRQGRSNVETLIVPDERHGFALFSNQILAAEATFAFLARHV